MTMILEIADQVETAEDASKRTALAERLRVLAGQIEAEQARLAAGIRNTERV